MYESIFTGYNVISLDLIYVIAILFGTLVIISKTPIISVLLKKKDLFNILLLLS